MRISDWSSDVCSSDLVGQLMLADGLDQALARRTIAVPEVCREARLGGIVGAKIDRPDDDLLCEQVPDGVIAKSFVDPSFLRAAEDFGRLAKVGRAGRDRDGRASGRERGCKYVSVSVGAWT